VGSPESADEIATKGFHAVTLAKPAVAAEIAKHYYAGLARAGVSGRRMGICRFVVVGETDQEAKALANRAYPIWHDSFFELFRRFNQKPQQAWPNDFEVMQAQGLAAAGSPSTVARMLGDQLELVGANYLVSQLVFGDMTLEESARSIGLFASDVMPTLLAAHESRKIAAASSA
jgi:alkanesulfonate monooxygenase SsuD/methylene tetrahydromethanopterin reductase-like flavin-dependent oxidoreductase (luciferase family)